MWLGFFLFSCSSIPCIRRSRSAYVLEEIPQTDVSHQSGNYIRMEDPTNTTARKIKGKMLTGITQQVDEQKNQQLENLWAKADDSLFFCGECNLITAES